MKPGCWWLIFLAMTVGKAFAVSGDPTCAKTYISLRKGPGAQFPISWKVARYMPFLRIDYKNGWAKVQDLDGETHWALSRDLSSGLHCIVVKATVATLRQKPSSTAPASELKTADRYTPFKRVDNQKSEEKY